MLERQTNHSLPRGRFSVAAARSHRRRDPDKFPRAPLGVLRANQGGGHGSDDVKGKAPNKYYQAAPLGLRRTNQAPIAIANKGTIS